MIKTRIAGTAALLTFGTKLLAEGLMHLSEAVRELHKELGSIETKVKALSDE